MLAFLGFAMVAILVYILITEKSNPAPAFVLIPVTAGTIALLYLMSGNPEIQFVPEFITYLKDGMSKTMPIAVMFIFSILYFSLMSDAGMFEPIVNWLAKKAGNNIVLVTISSCLIATISHLDGALASTLLVTIPAMLPVDLLQKSG